MRAFSVVLLAYWSYSAAAQLFSAQVPTCNPGFQWAFNSLDQSPCQIASALGEACTGLDFPIPNLTSTQNYLGPIPAAANQCRCSSVFYSVLSACAVCQGALVSSWSFYNQNCSTVLLTVFTPPIPSGVAVPHYAYLDPTANGIDTFNPQLAQADIGPESTALPSSTGTPTNVSPTGVPIPTDSNKVKKSNTGAIAGGVVGGVVALLLIGGLIFFLLRRRNRASTSSSPPADVFYSDKLVSEAPQSRPLIDTPTSSATPAPPARLYDPNDPSTFPAFNSDSFVPSLYASPSPPAHSQQFPPGVLAANHTGATTNYSSMGASSQPNIHNNAHVGHTGYTGTAEVM